MTVLIIGSGGREHALLKACQKSPLARRVICAPGNGGMAVEAECLPLDVEDVQGAVALARSQGVELAIIGPEVPLAIGMAEALRAAGILVYGPNSDGARLEASKAYSKDFFKRFWHPDSAASPQIREGRDRRGPRLHRGHPLPSCQASGTGRRQGVIIARTARKPTRRCAA
jgi:phosphoribosylamine--glycine ligase